MANKGKDNKISWVFCRRDATLKFEMIEKEEIGFKKNKNKTNKMKSK
jgi:hypothetical protein